MRTRAFTITAASFFLLAACSDGSLTHEELVSQANEICARTTAEEEQITGPSGEPTEETIAQYADVIGRTADLVEGAVDDLDGLTPPDEDDEAYARLVEAWGAVAESARAAQQAAADGDFEAAGAALEGVVSASHDADAAAEELGLQECRFER